MLCDTVLVANAERRSGFRSQYTSPEHIELLKSLDRTKESIELKILQRWIDLQDRFIEAAADAQYGDRSPILDAPLHQFGAPLLLEISLQSLSQRSIRKGIVILEKRLALLLHPTRAQKTFEVVSRLASVIEDALLYFTRLGA